MVRRKVVVFGAAVAARVDVDDHLGEAWLGVEQVVAHPLGDLVAGVGGQILVHGDVQLGAEGVAEPAGAHLVDSLHPGHSGGGALDAVDLGGLHGVHQAAVHGQGGILHDEQDGDRDQRADERVGQGETDDATDGAKKHGQRGEAVHAGVLAIGHQGGGADLVAHADAKDRHSLVSEEADDRGGDHPAHVADRRWLQQLLVALPSGDDRAGEDHQHHHGAGNILGAAVAVGVAAVGGALAQGEGDPERHGGEGVGEVVDRIGQQRHAAADQDDYHLEERRCAQADQRDLQGPDAPLAALQRRVDLVLCRVAVAKGQQLAQPAQRPALAVAVSCVVVVVVVVVLVAIVRIVVVAVVVIVVVVAMRRGLLAHGCLALLGDWLSRLG